MSTKSTTASRTKVVIATATLSCLLVLSGVAWAVNASNDGGEPSTRPGNQVTESGTPFAYTPLDGARKGLDPEAAVTDVIAGLNGRVRDIVVSRPGQGLGLHVDLASSNDTVPDVWVAGLAVGAVGELSRTTETALSQVIATAEASGPGNDGPGTWTGVGLGAAALGQAFSSPSDETLVERVQQAARSFGVTVDDVAVLHPLDSALDVTVTLGSTGGDNFTLDDFRAALIGTTLDIEGLLLRVRSENGSDLAISGIAYRTGEHGLWCAPTDQRLCEATDMPHLPQLGHSAEVED